MKPYLLSLGIGLIVGIFYASLGVRSPAPPIIALLGLMGMLVGEQAAPVARRILNRAPVMAFIKAECVPRVLGHEAIPAHDDRRPKANSSKRPV